MRKIFILTVVLMVGALGELSAQMELFRGTFQEALEKAKKEKKELFVDFYAEWCVPCKQMATGVFTLPEVGDYFNSRFVCVQINVEAKENKEVTKKYNVTALPTLVFIRTKDEKEIRRVEGAVVAEMLIREAKIATGEELSFEQLYEKYKKNKKDVDVQQQLLLNIPAFMMTRSKYEQQKWASRVESLFPEYVKNKKLENMINETDFMLLTMFHPQTDKDDPIFDFVVANYPKFVAVMDKNAVASYIIGMNNGYIIRLCRKGNLAYKDRLSRVNGDLKAVYSGFSFGSLSVQDAMTLLADATYNLYRHNEEAFFENMDKYFAGKGDQVSLGDYTQAMEDLASVYEGKLSQRAYAKCIPWISNALTLNMDIESRTRLLIMLGDCLKKTDNRGKAKQAYNQAFLASMQMEDKVMMQQFQQMIQQNLQGL